MTQPTDAAKIEREMKYLRFLVWKLSLPGLAEQHDKYKRFLARTYIATREQDWGDDDSAARVNA